MGVKRQRDFSDSSGSMVLALMLALLLISVSLIALSLLTWQIKKQQRNEADWETQTAMNSGVGWAAQNISALGANATCANINAYPTSAGSWQKNTNGNTTAASQNEAVGTERGLYRWWVSSCTATATGTKVTVKVEATNQNVTTRSSTVAANTALLSKTLVFDGAKLKYVLNN